MVRTRSFTCLLLAGCLLLAPSLKAQHYTVELTSPQKTAAGCIVILSLPGATAKEFTAHNIDDLRQSTNVQQLLSGKYVFMVPDSMQAGITLHYRLSPKRISRSASVLTGVETDSALQFFAYKKPVLQYRKSIAFPQTGDKNLYAGSGFFHPVYSPDGDILTDDFPAGHAHQNGIFSAWTRAVFRGDTLDFWNRHQQRGRVEHYSADTLTKGTTAIQMQTSNRMVSALHGPVLLEKRTTTLYATDQHYIFDIEQEQTNTTSDTLFILPYHYGGMAIRGNKAWNPDDRANFRNPWQVLTDAGYRDSAANGTHARWVTCWGKLGDTQAGIAVFSAPENFRHPQAIRVHPTMPYWCFAPCMDGGFYIAPGQTNKSRYRYFTFSGVPDLQEIDRVHTMLRNPPSVQVSVQ